MKVKDLKAALDKFPDDMDVVAYNGFVNDWHNIELDPTILIKEKPKQLLEAINKQARERGYKECTKAPKRDWVFPGYQSEQLLKHFYSKKKVLLINLINRDKSVSDRLGKIEY